MKALLLSDKTEAVLCRTSDIIRMAAAGGDTLYIGQRQPDGTVEITRTEAHPGGRVDVTLLGTRFPDNPANIALALLIDAAADITAALDYSQEFAEKFVCGWGSHWQLTASLIRRWVQIRRITDGLKEVEADAG